MSERTEGAPRAAGLARGSRWGLVTSGAACGLIAIGLAITRAVGVGRGEARALDALASRIELAWLASQGALSTLTTRSHDGILPQLMAWPVAWASAAPDQIAFSLTLVSATWTAGLAWLAVRRARPSAPTVTVGVATAAVFALALHHEADAPAALALLLAAQRLGDGGHAERAGSREALGAVGWVLFAAAWTPLALVPGVAALLGAALAEGIARRDVRALSRHRDALGALLFALVVWVVLDAGLGGELALWESLWLTPIERGPALPSLGLTTFALVGAAMALHHARVTASVGAAVRVTATLSIFLAGLLGWRLQHVGALMWPLAATLAFEAWRMGRRHPRLAWALAGWAALFPIAWAPANTGALSPSAWLAAWRAPADDDASALLDEREAMVGWAAGLEDGACVVWPPEERLSRVRARIRGPADPLRAVRSGAQLAAQIERARCPHALVRSASPDGAAGPGADTATIAARYVARAELSPSLVVLSRRGSDARIAERGLALERWLSDPFEVPGQLDVRLRDAAGSDELLRLEVEVEAASLFTPPAFAQALRDGEPVGPRVALPSARARREHDVHLFASDLAAAAWTVGVDARPAVASIDAVRFFFEPPGPLGPAYFTVHEVTALRSPHRPFEPHPECEGQRALRRPAGVAAAVESERVEWGDEAIRLRPAGDGAEAFTQVNPCTQTCLFAEVGAEGAAATALTVEVVGGMGARTEVQQELASGWPRPVVLPLSPSDRWLVFRAEGGAAVVHRPRLGRCGAHVELVHALHQGAYARVPEDVVAEVTGDELRLALRPPHAVPPRIELTLPERFPSDLDPCVSVDLALRDASGPAGLLVGVRRGRELFWLERRILTTEEPVRLQDVPLRRFAETDASLVFSAWPIGQDVGGVAVFARPRIYACGEEPPWPF